MDALVCTKWLWGSAKLLTPIYTPSLAAPLDALPDAGLRAVRPHPTPSQLPGRQGPLTRCGLAGKHPPAHFE